MAAEQRAKKLEEDRMAKVSHHLLFAPLAPQ